MARVSAAGTAAWYLTDRLGSVRDLADAAGAVQDHRDYDGFGGLVSESNPAFGDRYGYTGREYDADVRLQYHWHRYLDPVTGRWISEGPLGFQAGDSNLYRYVGNTATNKVDPSGLAVASLPGTSQFSPEHVRQLRQSFQGLAKGQQLREQIWLDKVNAARAKKQKAALESAADIDVNEAWVEAGEEAVILKMLQDHPDDAPRLLHRARIHKLRIVSDQNKNWFYTREADIRDGRFVVTLAETKGWAFPRPLTVKEASDRLYEMLQRYVDSSWFSKTFEGAGRLFTGNVRQGFVAAGMEQELRDYEALIEEFEVEVATAGNYTYEKAKDEVKSQVANRAGGHVIAGAGVMVTKLASTARKLKTARGAAKAASGVSSTPRRGVGGYQEFLEKNKGKWKGADWQQQARKEYQALVEEEERAAQAARIANNPSGTWASPSKVGTCPGRVFLCMSIQMFYLEGISDVARLGSF
jgi:RHS repeat-associated protein